MTKMTPTKEEEVLDITKKAMQFYLDYLKIEDCDIELHVEEFEKKDIGKEAYVRTYKEYGKYKHSVHIGSKNRDLYSIITALAHEIIHVHQFERGDLSILNHKCLWKGWNLQWLPYWFKPWEVEAFNNQVTLRNKFIKKMNYLTPGFFKDFRNRTAVWGMRLNQISIILIMTQIAYWMHWTWKII